MKIIKFNVHLNIQWILNHFNDIILWNSFILSKCPLGKIKKNFCNTSVSSPLMCLHHLWIKKENFKDDLLMLRNEIKVDLFRWIVCSLINPAIHRKWKSKWNELSIFFSGHHHQPPNDRTKAYTTHTHTHTLTHHSL